LICLHLSLILFRVIVGCLICLSECMMESLARTVVTETAKIWFLSLCLFYLYSHNFYLRLIRLLGLPDYRQVWFQLQTYWASQIHPFQLSQSSAFTIVLTKAILPYAFNSSSDFTVVA
jgi:hypothetical protein